MSYVLVTGAREWTDKALIREALRGKLREGDILLQGGNGYWKPAGRAKEWLAKDNEELMRCQRGADALAAQAAQELGFAVETHFAQWGTFGRSAGPRRNEEMRHVPGIRLALAFHDNLHESRGTRDMCKRLIHDGVDVMHCTHEYPLGYPLSRYGAEATV